VVNFEQILFANGRMLPLTLRGTIGCHNIAMQPHN